MQLRNKLKITTPIDYQKILAVKGLFSISLIVISSLILGFDSPEGKSDLTLFITNIKKVHGIIRIGVYNKKENFPVIGKEFKRFSFKVEEKNFKCVMKDLPVGNYAIALYHDENSDGTCNANCIGIPTESYGFSNNIKPFLSAPSFHDTKFSHSTGRSIYINLFH